MEKLKGASTSSSRDKPDQIISDTNNSNSNESSYKKRTALMGELETKIDALNVSKEEKDAISDAINNVFKWYETENQQLQTNNGTLLNDLDICSDESGQRNERMQRAVTEKEQNIERLNQKIVRLETKFRTAIKRNDRIETLKDEIMELKQALSVAEDEKKDALVKAGDLNERNELLKNQLSTAEHEVEKMKSNVAQQNNTINGWKEMFEEAHAQSDQLNRRNAELEIQLQTSSPQDAREIEASKKIISDLQKQLSASTRNFNAKFKTLENEIIALKKENFDLETAIDDYERQLEKKESTIMSLIQRNADDATDFDRNMTPLEEENDRLKHQIVWLEARLQKSIQPAPQQSQAGPFYTLLHRQPPGMVQIYQPAFHPYLHQQYAAIRQPFIQNQQIHQHYAPPQHQQMHPRPPGS